LEPSDRVSFGLVQFEPGASNVVPGVSRIVAEVRSGSVQRIETLKSIIRDSAHYAARRTQTEFVEKDLAWNEPAILDEAVSGLIEAACADLSYSHERLSSGAGHDAQSFAKIIPTGMIFVPSHQGISHHPAEYTEPEHLIAGYQVLLNTVSRLLSPMRSS
jgi:N-carbamoyl-L-amino-acid hydrolase